MTIPTFTPPRAPDVGLSRKPEVKLLEADFGDGYTQAVGDGSNFIRDVVTLTWSGLSAAEADGMFSFWTAQGGGMSHFYYTLPGQSSPIKWTWKDYSQSWSGSGTSTSYTITATFRQSFNIST
jgi:phage-related protein